MQIETGFGFTVTAAADAAGTVAEYETFEKLVALDRGDYGVLPELLTAIFGDEGKKELLGKLKETKGSATTADVYQVFREALGQLGDASKK